MEATDSMGEDTHDTLGGLMLAWEWWRFLCKWHGARRLQWLHRSREAVVLLLVVLPFPCPCPVSLLPMTTLTVAPTLPAPLKIPLSLIPPGLIPLATDAAVNPSNVGAGAGSTSAVELLILPR